MQPIDDPFVGHRGCVTTSSFRFFAEERAISRKRGVRRHLIHIDLTFAQPGAIHPTLQADFVDVDTDKRHGSETAPAISLS
jgi:hypothetical protein